MDVQDDAAPAAEKKTINVATAFTVIINGAPVRVEAGVQKVDAEVADHWYAALHLVQGGFGTEEYAKACRAAADAAFVKAKAAHDLFVGLEDAAEDAEEAAGLAVSDSAMFRLGGLRLGSSSGELTISELARDYIQGAGAAEVSLSAGADLDAVTTGPSDDGGPDPTPATELTPVGGAGDDSVSAGLGDDSLGAGGAGDDSASSGAGDDSVVAGQGDDSTAAPAAETASAAPAADAVADAVADAYPALSAGQEKALDRDGDGKPGGAPAGGNRPRRGGGL